MKKLAIISCIAGLAMSSAVFAASHITVVNNTGTSINFEYRLCNSENNWCPESGAWSLDTKDRQKKIRLDGHNNPNLGQRPFFQLYAVNEINENGYPISNGAKGRFSGDECKADAAGQIIELVQDQAKKISCKRV